MENYHFTVGTLKCLAVSDGTETVSAESVVKDVPVEQWRQALLEHGESPDETTVYFNCLYIQTDRHQVLVDAGWGRDTQRRDGALLDRLQAEGIHPADIDHVVITHGDSDHVGGLTTSADELVFPNATHVLLKDAWDFWSNEALLAKWPEFLTVFGRKTLPLLRNRLKIVEAGREFLPGFQLIPAPGHRPGHTALLVTSAGDHLLHLADVVGHPVLMEHPSWQWAFDARPDQAAKDKFQILNQAILLQASVFGSHLPFPGVGRVAALKEGWRWQPLTT